MILEGLDYCRRIATEGPDGQPGAEAGSDGNEPLNGSVLQVFGWLRLTGTRRWRGNLGDVAQAAN